MWSSRLRTAVFMALYLSVATLAGCATTAPVQEMSDARQALRAAEQASAHEKQLPSYLTARQLLDSAEALLLEGQFGAARRKADRARQYAVEARREALGETP